MNEAMASATCFRSLPFLVAGGGGVSLPLPAMAAVTQSVRTTSRAESSEFMSLKVSRADSVVENRSAKQGAPLEGRFVVRAQFAWIGHLAAQRSPSE
jgi:hypothetical protein